MSVRAAAWCLWLAALAPLSASLYVHSSNEYEYVEALSDPDVTWPECQTTNNYFTIPKGTRDFYTLALYIQNCNISSLEPERFSNLPNLGTIQLQSNNIAQLDVTLFASLTKLKELYLAKNSLLGKELPSRLFINNRKLQVIDLSYNDMNDAPFDLLRGLGELTWLSLEHCGLRRVPFLVTQPLLKKLVFLLLSFNHIQRIDDPETFSRLEGLHNLNLSHNLIEYLHEDTFKPLTKLNKVYLNNNRLKYIPEKLFQNHNFVVINLSENLIEYLPANAFLNSVFVMINLSGNRLTYLPDTIYSAFVKQNTGIIGPSQFNPNPWQCACLNEILVQFKRRGIAYDSTGLDGKQPVCELTDGPCNKNTRIALPYT